MKDRDYYPAGAYNDPYAPYNWPENDPEEFDCFVSQTLSKTTGIFTDQYIAEWDGEQGVDYDLSEVDWPNEYHANDHYTPLQLIELFKKELESKLELADNPKEQKWCKFMIEECSNWTEDECEICGG